MFRVERGKQKKSIDPGWVTLVGFQKVFHFLALPGVESWGFWWFLTCYFDTIGLYNVQWNKHSFPA